MNEYKNKGPIYLTQEQYDSLTEKTVRQEYRIIGVDLEEIIDDHIADKENHHEVTKAQVGLGNVENKTLDTTVTAGSGNYITSGTVKTYVDTYGGKIDTISVDNVTQPIVNKNVNIDLSGNRIKCRRIRRMKSIRYMDRYRGIDKW